MPDKLSNPSINNSHINDIYESAVLKLNELAAMNYESEYARAMETVKVSPLNTL